MSNLLFLFKNIQVKYSALILIIFFWSCVTKQHETAKLSISFTTDHKAVSIKGLDYAAIADLKQDSIDSVWMVLLPVYKMPADTDMKDYQPEQPGKYQIINSGIVTFTPDTPFIKGQVYFMRSFNFANADNALTVIRAQRRPGSVNYNDIIFRY